MKRLLLICFATLSLSAVGSAVTISATCTPNPAPYLGQNGGGNEVCAFALPGGATVNSITAQYIFDFQFNGFNPGAKAASFSFDAPGTSADFSGTATDPGGRPVTSSVLNIAAGEWSLYTGANFTVVDAYTGASSAVTGGTFSKMFTLDYTDTTVPEPSAYAMIGLGLGALALLRRK